MTTIVIIHITYKFLIHFLPLGLSVYAQNAPTITAHIQKKVAIISIIYYFKILFPILANPISMNNPEINIDQAAFSSKILLSSNSINDKLITNEPNKVFDNEKKYSANFSFLTLSFSFNSFFISICLLYFPIF